VGVAYRVAVSRTAETWVVVVVLIASVVLLVVEALGENWLVAGLLVFFILYWAHRLWRLRQAPTG
jgi:hypothetical protein